MITMHPGEYISAMFMAPDELTTTELAEKLEVSVASVSRILNGKSDVTPRMALKLEDVLGRSAESWLSMQSDFSLEKERAARRSLVSA